MRVKVISQTSPLHHFFSFLVSGDITVTGFLDVFVRELIVKQRVHVTK